MFGTSLSDERLKLIGSADIENEKLSFSLIYNLHISLCDYLKIVVL